MPWPDTNGDRVERRKRQIGKRHQEPLRFVGRIERHGEATPLKIVRAGTITILVERDTLKCRSISERDRQIRHEVDMTQSSNRILDDFAKLMTDAAGVAQGMQREAKTAFRAQAERFIGDMDLVKREEFDVLRKMVIRLREENAELKTRLEALESRLPVPAKTDETV